jgi:hypothetical protein
LEQKPKKSSRDLSDLKARLGLTKPSDGPAPGAAPGQPAPPPGVVPPPGVAQPAQQAPQADLSRNPFATAAPAATQAPQVITDAGPLVEIPEEKKSPTKLIILLVITAAIPLFVGWACGRIYGARILFNKTIDDAARIKKEVAKISALNKKIAGALAESRVRFRGKVLYDEKLLEDLKDIRLSSAFADPEKAKKRQDELFRTNYAMMEDIAINRLFNYYNNTLRLLMQMEVFLQKTNRSRELIKSYSDQQGAQGLKKYGIVFAEDAGNYYLGQLVEVGNIVCEDKAAKECKKDQIEGFMIRSGVSGSWAPRIGKPKGKHKITEIVIPIIPDENWRQVAVGRRGYLAFKEYTLGYARMSAIAALLARDEKSLTQDLGKAAGVEKLFAPF